MDLTTYLTLRSSNLATLKTANHSVSTLTGSTLIVTSVTASTLVVSTINGALPGSGSVSALSSTIISIGASTNQTYNNFSNGSYLTWVTAKEAMSSANKTVQSANGLYQMIVANATSGLFLSSDSGITWSALTGGLPTLTGNAYWSDGAISANGQYITLSIYGGSLWMSADYGRTFALTNQPTPNIWLPLNGNTTDSMGLSVVTTPGTVPGYVTLNYPGYTAQAVNLLNTAGSTATRYIRGTWAGASNFTVSFWMNPQALNGTSQAVFCAYSLFFLVAIDTSNRLYLNVPTGGGSSFQTIAFTSALSINTWYYITGIFQTNGLCSFYVNNILIGSITNTQGVGSLTTSQFSLGTFDTATSQAFNGYVDDLRITNSVSAYVPIPLLQPNIWMPFENSAGDLGSYSLPLSAVPFIYLPFEGNLTDSMGGTAATASSPTPPTYVAANREGYTGQALRLTNPAGSTAAQYARGPWTGASNFTVSFWFNAQSLGQIQVLFSAYSTSFVIYLSASNTIGMTIPTGGTVVNASITPYTISSNTWYYITGIFQTNTTCSLYVNNSLVGTYTNSGGVGTYTTTTFSLGTYDTSFLYAFNGTIDDLRIYNSAIPYVPVSVTTVTGSLSYVPGVVGLNAVNIANTAGGTATNFIKGACSPMGSDMTVSGWVNIQSFSTAGYQVIFEMYTNAIELYTDDANRRIVGRVASGSGTAYTDMYTTISPNTWYHVCIIFKINGVCSFYVNGTLIQTVTNSGGYGTRTSTSIFSLGTYATLSSINAFNGYIDDFRIYNAAIPIQTLFSQNYRSLSLSGTGQYALAAAASGWVVGSSNAGQTWSKQAVNVGTQAPASSSLSINHTGQYQLVATGPAAGSVMPNQTGLASSTWTQGGVNWGVSASTFLTGWNPYTVFNNSLGSNGDAWASASLNYSSTGDYTGSVSTTVSGIGTVTGEWLQLQSSVPLVMASYIMSSAHPSSLSKSYVIAGSNDGTTWYAIQSATWAANPFGSGYTTLTSYINANLTGTQTLTGSTTQNLATTSYTTSTSAYTYFRAIGITNFATGSNGYYEIGEWFINFRNSVSYSTNYGSTWLNTRSTVSNESVALSPSGQYALSTNSVTPFARLPFDGNNLDSQGVLTPTTGGTGSGNVGYPGNQYKIGTNAAYITNTAGATSSLSYLNYTVPAALYLQNILTMSCWIYPTANPASGNPCPMGFNNNSTSPGTLFQIVSGTNYIAFSAWTTTGGSASILTTTAVTLNTWTHLVGTFSNGVLSFYVNGVLQGTATVTGSLSVSGGANITNLFIGAAYTTWGGYRGYVDDARIYTSALSADEVNGLFRNPALTQRIAISSSYLPIASYSEPILPGISNNVVDTAVSQTGQYMVAVTSSTTNNVYYSTDYGTTFTALTVGSSAMVSCSISYDGSYLTVTNATTTYTLNRNARGFTLAIGSQAGAVNQAQNAIAIGEKAGLINQAQNAIAIGNKAGQTNQSATSIILNATGAALDAAVPGFYVAPIATATSSSASFFSLLGYGTDNQVVQSSALTVLQNGNVGIGTTLPVYLFDINGTSATRGVISAPTLNTGQLYNYTVSTVAGRWYKVISMPDVQSKVIFRIKGTVVAGTNPHACSYIDILISTDNVSGAIFPQIKQTDSYNGMSWADFGLVYVISSGYSTIYIKAAAGVIVNLDASATSKNGTGANSPIIYNSSSVYTLAFSGTMTTAIDTALTGTLSQFDVYTNINVKYNIIVNSTGNVGVGTSTPGYPLHVVGNINLTGSILYNGVAITTGTASYWNTGTGGVIYYNGGFVGIGTAAPLSRFTIRCGYSDGQTGGLCIDSSDGTIYNMRLSSFVQGSSQVGYQFGVNNQAASYPNMIVLGYNGNVGIGNTLPLGPLAVGNSAIANSDGFIVQGRNNGAGGSRHNRMGYDSNFNFVLVGDYGHSNTVSTWNPQVYCAYNSPANSLAIAASGNVGIGSGSPGATLDVPGTTKLGPLGAGIAMGGGNFKVAITGDTNGLNPLAMGAYNDGYWCIAFYSAGGAVRGTILGVNSGSISFNTTSDRRRKDNIQDMSSMISKIKALKPRTYTWKESGDKDDGFVAQEVHKVFPQFITSAVSYCDICHHSYSDLYDGKLCECCDFENPIGKDGTPHYYGLDYGKFTPYLTKALQETIGMVESQAEQITALQAANTATSNQMAALLAWAQTQGFSGTF